MKRLFVFIAIGFLTPGGAGAAFAQEQDANVQEARLDEIVVTAQKRTENIQDVPLSVTAIGAETLKFKNIADLNDAQFYLPNVNILASNAFNFIWMRGLGSDYNKGFEQSVGIIIDGVSLGRGSYLTGGLLDLASIEVLRGPQGTLYGKNTIAGALHMKTGNPEFDFGGHAEVLFGERDHQRYRGVVTGPLFSDQLAFRIAGSRDEADGPTFNEVRGVDEGNIDAVNGRLKLRHKMDWLDVTLSVEGAMIEDRGPQSQLYSATEDILFLYQAFDPRTEDDVFNGKKQMDAPAYSDKDIINVILTGELSLGEYAVNSVTSMSLLDEDVLFDADMGPAPIIDYRNDERFEQYTQELRLTSPEWEKFDFVMGAFWSWNNLKTQANAGLIKDDIGGDVISILIPAAADGSIGGPLADAVNLIASGAVSAGLGGEGYTERAILTLDQVQSGGAVFGQASWHVLDWMTLIGGVRVSYDKKEVDAQQRLTGTKLVFPSLIPGVEEFDVQRERDEWDVSPKASIKVDLAEDVMAYAMVARGFKSGGYSDGAANARELEFDSEVSWTYEAGVKGDYFDGIARLNLGLFRTEFQNLQTSAFNGFSFVVGNAAEAISQGVELEGWLMLSENLMITASGALLDATYESFVNGPCSATSGEEAPCDQSGTTLPYAPEWSGTAGFIYDIPLGNLPFRLVTSADLTFSDEIFFTVDHDPVDTSDAYYFINARVGFADVDDNWSFLVYIDNVTDEKVLASSDDTPLAAGTHFGAGYPRRSIEAEFRVYF